MKITIYELLGLIKDDKAPKEIKYENEIYVLDYIEYFYYATENKKGLFEHIFGMLGDYDALKQEVIILDDLEQEKKIPEKLESYISCGWYGTCKDLKREELFEDLKKIGSKINEIIDYLKSKGE